jgi:hypothetical protein
MGEAQLKFKGLEFKDIKPVEGLIGPLNISTEVYREYIQPDGSRYIIQSPLALFMRTGGTTHRVVVEDGTVHCVPVGPSTVIVWRNRNIFDPVNW